jgi:diguanylate cyclase (GGDEF)-like protein
MLLARAGSLEVNQQISKALTLGKIDDYAKQNELQAVVYSGERVLLGKELAAELGPLYTDAETGELLEWRHQDKRYYVYHTDFELWDWHFLLLKDGAHYADFISKISNSYYAIGAVFLLATLLLVFYFRRVIHQPVNAIINAIQTTGIPSYKGIYEFEFLSNIIADARKKEQQKQLQISYQATHDSLTGLVNRREFENRLDSLLKRPGSAGTQHTLLYLDLDQFKIVNDTCGHHAGDTLLRHLTSILQTKIRHSDVLARLGGDEFGLLLEACDGDHAYRIAESLRQTAREFRFVWGDKSFAVGVSVGLVTFAGEGTTLNDILRVADGACYVAKEKGRNRIHVYRPDDGELAERQGQMNWVGRISRAFEEDRLLLYRQKIIPLQNTFQARMRYEFLIRMLSEDGEIIPPQAFLPAAERYNVIPSIDFWVISKVFELYERDCKAGQASYTCSINLSGATLSDDRLLPYISEQFERFDIPPTAICFEITETTAIANMTVAMDLIARLKELGCQFALDDFGSGMASFGYLKNLAVDYIKIDGSFVTDFLHDPVDRAMVESINHIGHVMGIQTIAEHVADPAVLQALRDAGVDFAQGYVIGYPEPAIS